MSTPARIIVGPQRLTEFWFLKRSQALPKWVAPPALAPTPAAAGDISHLFTDDVAGVPHLREALLELIGSAKQKVFFCSFLFADEQIVKALAAAAERLRGGVYVLTALKDFTPDLSDLEEDLEQRAETERNRRQRHEQNLRRLSQAGAWLRGIKDCHAKFCVVDDEVALVTSANATSEAYTRNPENGVLVREPSVARELGRLFAGAWLYAANLESMPGGDLDVCSRNPGPLPPWAGLAGGEPLRAVATFGQTERSLLERTLALIDGARQELVIASYSAVGLQKHAVGAALKRALARGVRLLLVLRPRPNEDQQATCSWLLESVPPEQVCVRGHRLTHAKAIVADGHRALLWTGNLDGHHGYDNGIEVGIEFSRPEAVRLVRDYVVALAGRAGYSGVFGPTLAELAEAGEESLAGEGVLRIPAQVRGVPEDLAARLAAQRVGYFRAEGRLVLRVGRELHLVVRETEAVWTLEEVVMGGRFRAHPLAGWVSDCTLVIDVETRPTVIQMNNPRGHRGGHQRGRRR